MARLSNLKVFGSNRKARGTAVYKKTQEGEEKKPWENKPQKTKKKKNKQANQGASEKKDPEDKN